MQDFDVMVGQRLALGCQKEIFFDLLEAGVLHDVANDLVAVGCEKAEDFLGQVAH